jgi:signal peptidase I
MSNIKLQVGKTYRSREGEEVKIVKMGNMGWDYWSGNNGEWYYEGGKWSHFAEEHPKDLVEEVTEIRHTFTIPNNMKTITINQVGNRIVLEMIPEERKEPKPGDVMINDSGSVYIFKEINANGGFHNNFAWLGKDGSLEIEGTCYPGRPATSEEAQPLFAALQKAGKRWRPKTMQIEDIGPKPGDIMINKFGSVYIFKNVYYDGWHNNFVWVDNNGRAFYNNTSACFPGRLATLEEAKLLFDALKKAGKRWNAETMQVEDIGPRPGDVMINENGSVYIFKDVVDNGNHRYFAWFGKDGRLFIEGTCLPGRSATPEETKLLFDALKKEGKQWNPKTMEIEDVPEIDHIRKWVEKHLDYRYYNHESLTKVIYNYLKHKEGENER